MTSTTDGQIRRTDRRQFLTGLGTVIATFGHVPIVAQATGNGGRTPLATGPLDFQIYSSMLGTESDDDPNTESEFGFPDNPMFRFHDPTGTTFFDPSEIEMTPNGNTLHHALRFFNGWLIDRMPTPYPLVHERGGRYTERGQTMNFRARSLDAIQSDLTDLADQLGLTMDELHTYVTIDPLVALAGRRWRAVGNDVVSLVDKGDPRPVFALTRIDFYTRGAGSPELDQSLLYVIWPDDAPDNGDYQPGSIPANVQHEAIALIEAGAANLGGQ